MSFGQCTLGVQQLQTLKEDNAMHEHLSRQLLLLVVATLLALAVWSTPLLTYACQGHGGGCG